MRGGTGYWMMNKMNEWQSNFKLHGYNQTFSISVSKRQAAMLLDIWYKRLKTREGEEAIYNDGYYVATINQLVRKGLVCFNDKDKAVLTPAGANIAELLSFAGLLDLVSKG